MSAAETWLDYSEALAFVGNSLLAPMSQTGSMGLDSAFWEGFRSFGDARVERALASCAAFAREAQKRAEGGEDPVRDVSVEYTRLFVGPPHPLAAPWETMYRPESEGSSVGFGQATFEMRALLQEAGLEVSNENNQYADHVGIELLYASVLCRDCAESASAGDAECESQAAGKACAFADDRLLVWLPRLRDAVEANAAGGYLSRILSLTSALLTALRTHGDKREFVQ